MSDLNDILNSGKGKLPEDKLIAYFEGRLSHEEQHEVETWLVDEGMEADALEGLKGIPSAQTQNIVSQLNTNLSKHLHKKTRRRTKAIKDNNWAWIAVIIILLLCIAAYIVMHYSVGN